jgi:ankyrin repeat protein
MSVLNDIELARWLLDHGMDPQIGSIPPNSPRQPASYNGSKGWLLYRASHYSSIEIFTLLHDRGANLEYAHALHGAACGGPSQIPIIRYLLDRRYLDVNELDTYHIPHAGTPLLAAILAGHVEVVRVLLDYGADPHACKKNPYEKTAMSIAQALARRDEEASKEILDILKEAIEKWDADPGNAPVSSVP